MNSIKRNANWSTCLLPPRLKPNDTIAIAAPAGPVVPDDIHLGLAALASRYRVVYDERIFEKQGFLAGSDAHRAEEFNKYLNNPDVRAIFCARGGYGMLRILDQLDADALRRDPKIIIGFSDITVLLAWCIMEAQVRPIHGPTVTQLGRLPAEDQAWLFRLVETPGAPGPLPGTFTRHGFRSGGTIVGRLVGGNLELLTRLLGTPWAFDLGASILFLEEIGERPYRVDRALTQLKLTGALTGVRAVALGEFTHCEEPDGSGPTTDEVVDERLSAWQIPGITGLPVGHGRTHCALPLGAMAAIDWSTPSIYLEEGAVV